LHVFVQWIVSPSGGAWSIVITMFVCLSVCLHISKTRCLNFTNFSVHVTCECGSDVLWRPCNILCTSIFMDDVMFLDNGVYLAYGEAYGRGMSVSGRQRREGQSFGTSDLCLSVGCHWLTSASGRPRHTQRSLAVEANNALCTRTKSAVLNFLVITWFIITFSRNVKVDVTVSAHSLSSPHIACLQILSDVFVADYWPVIMNWLINYIVS